MKYQYRKAPNQTEFSVFTGLATSEMDLATLAKDVPCQNACPAHTDVPAYIQALSRNQPELAYRINLEDNVFPSVLGRTCTRPCESACRHNWTNISGPVRICHLKRSSADRGTTGISPLPAWFSASSKKVAIIGGGPAGLTAARELTRYGHQVELFERRDHLGGMMLDGIPRFRLPKADVEREIQLITDSGITVHLSANVDVKRFSKLIDEFDAILVAAGTIKPKSLQMSVQGSAPSSNTPTSLAGVSDGLEFMRRYNDGEITTLQGDVVVVGGGFTAVDCARACARAARKLLGSDNNVSIAYRRTEASMSADLDELEEITHEQIGIRTLLSPIGVRYDNGKLVAAIFERNIAKSPKVEGGKPEIEAIAGSRVEIPCSHLIVAIGQDADFSILPHEIKLDTKASSGNIDADQNPGQHSSHPKIFAAGDFLTGSSDVIHAVAEGKAAADEIDRFLTGVRRIKHHVAVELIINEKQTGRTRDHDLQRTPPMPLRPLAERADPEKEVELGFDDAALQTQSTRCYLCNHKFEIDQDKCIHCEWCLEVTPRNCIKKVSRVFRDAKGSPSSYTEASTPKEATFIYIDSNDCIRCGKCLRVCPTKAISMRRMERTPCTVAHTSGLKIATRQIHIAPAGLGGAENLAHQATSQLNLPTVDRNTETNWLALEVKKYQRS